MDDLDMFEVATGRASIGGAASGSAGSGVGGDESARGLSPSNVTPAKRRKVKPSASPATSLASPDAKMGMCGEVKAELLDDDDGASTVAVKDLGDKGGQARACLGCRRHYNSPEGWVPCGGAIAWGRDNGAGAWCDCCHRCWRTCFSHEHSLQLFGVWLRVPTNFRKWTPWLASFVSLMREEHSKITFDMVQERMRSIQHVLGLFGLPSFPCAVRSIKELHDEGVAICAADASRLVCMVVGSETRVGMFVDMDMSTVPGHFLRPVSSAGMMHPWSHLATQSQEDRVILEEWFGGEYIGQPVVEDKQEQGLGQSKLELKLAAYIVNVQPLLKTFSESMWESTKEPSFTVHVNKFMSLYHEAATVGETSVLADTEAWLAGLRAAKKFLRTHREYSRTNYKHAKLVELGESLLEFRQFFIDKVRLKFIASLELLWHKTVFFKAASAHLEGSTDAKGPATAGTAAILDNGVLEIFETMPTAVDGKASSTRLSFSAWMRVPVFKIFADQMSSAEDESKIRGMWEDADSTHRLLAAKAKGRESAASELLEDLFDYATILRCVLFPATVLASHASSALDKLEVVRFKPLKDVLHESAVGKGVLSSAACVLQVSAKDSCGDGKLALANTVMQDDRLPRLTLPDRNLPFDGCIENFSLVTGMGIVDIMHDSVAHATEALGLWSSVRLEQQAGPLFEWVQELVRSLTFYDEGLSIYLQALVGNFLENGPSADNQDAALAREVAGFVELASKLDRDSINEEPLLHFVESFIKFLEGIPEPIKKKVSLQEEAHTLESKIIHNVKVRQQIWKLLSAACQVTDLPSTVNDALDEWSAKRTSGGDGSSFLVRGVHFMKVFREMSESELSLGSDGGEITLILDEGSGENSISGSFLRARSLTTDLAKMQLPAYILKMVQDCVQLVADKFVSSLCFPGFTLGQSTNIDRATLLESVDVLIDKSVLNDAIKSVAKIFTPGTRKDISWDSDGWHDLLRNLMEAAPAGDLMISVAGLPTHDSGGQAFVLQVSAATFLDQVAVLYKGVSQVGLTLAYLRVRYLSKAEGCLRDHLIKQEVESAISFLKSTSVDLLHRIKRGVFMDFKRASTEKWPVPMESCLHFLECMHRVLPSVCRWIVTAMVTELSALMMEVQKATPQYEHIVSDTKYYANLARTHILKWPSRGILTNKGPLLFKVIADVSRVHTAWSLQPSLHDDEDFKDVASMAEAVFESARKAIVLMAALSVLLEKSNDDDGAKQAEVLITKKSDILPKAVIRELRKLAGAGEVKAASDDTT